MKKEMKLIFSDGKIYLALLVMLLCFNGYSIPIWIEIWDWDFAYRESALQLTIGGIFFGGIMLLMPFLASIPAAPLQVEEIRTLFAEQRIFSPNHSPTANKKLMKCTSALLLPMRILAAVYLSCCQLVFF